MTGSVPDGDRAGVAWRVVRRAPRVTRDGHATRPRRMSGADAAEALIAVVAAGIIGWRRSRGRPSW